MVSLTLKVLKMYSQGTSKKYGNNVNVIRDNVSSFSMDLDEKDPKKIIKTVDNKLVMCYYNYRKRETQQTH